MQADSVLCPTSQHSAERLTASRVQCRGHTRVNQTQPFRSYQEGLATANATLRVWGKERSSRGVGSGWQALPGATGKQTRVRDGLRKVTRPGQGSIWVETRLSACRAFLHLAASCGASVSVLFFKDTRSQTPPRC